MRKSISLSLLLLSVILSSCGDDKPERKQQGASSAASQEDFEQNFKIDVAWKKAPKSQSESEAVVTLTPRDTKKEAHGEKLKLFLTKPGSPCCQSKSSVSQTAENQWRVSDIKFTSSGRWVMDLFVTIDGKEYKINREVEVMTA